jgi:serine/threonine protein kinase
LNRIESYAFQCSSLKSIEIPQSIQFIACNAYRDPRQISLANVDSCPEYARWQRLRNMGIQVDFRRIRRFDSDLPSQSDCLFNLFGFRERSQLSANKEFLTQKYQGCDDGFEVIVKSMNRSVCVDIAHLERRIENLMNLRHPCISSTIGVVLRSPLQELQIIRQYSSGGSLSEVMLTSPEWWTPTAKVKAIVGIVLSMRFAHSYGLLHGHLTANNVLFTDDGLIQICDFCVKSLSDVGSHPEAMAEAGGFSGKSWRPAADVRAFAELLSKIVIGDSAEESGCSLSVPEFVLKMIERGESLDSNEKLSFVNIFETLKANQFRILEGVDSKEVSDFVNWIEFSEALTE